MSDGAPVRTALYDEHVALDANIVDFHGFELPIWYSNIKAEHLATRSSAGLFDVSHMGSFRFTGANVKLWLESLATQKVSAIQAPRCAYTHFLDHDGHLIDDMIFAVVSDEEILGVPNASMIQVMWDWFSSHLPSDGSVALENLSADTSIMALQGPEAKSILSSVLGESNHVPRFKWQRIGDNELGIEGWIQGTGYTGEAGYEIFVPNTQAPLLWRNLIEAGSIPIGLGARDTLRLEKGFLLSGVDFCWPPLAEEDSREFLCRDSWETNVPFGLDLEHEFIGKHRVIGHDESDARWLGIRYLEKGPLPRPGKEVTTLDGSSLGKLTSGAPAPSLENIGIGIGYLHSVTEGDEVLILASPRKSVRAVVVSPPFI
ncbi:MAG TPA: glycine cleavage T C-terminal barrel domain-containing protein [Candidatus Poseidoniaceae archaeon]|jgi:aminomethyltransferase|nr:glycine cleavage T C-terminal barrel domain-containing protein [Candidatus Poseidoniaceae archaeon]